MNTESVSLKLSPAEAQQLDVARGGMTRGEFARRAMQKALASPVLIERVRSEYWDALHSLSESAEPKMAEPSPMAAPRAEGGPEETAAPRTEGSAPEE